MQQYRMSHTVAATSWNEFMLCLEESFDPLFDNILFQKFVIWMNIEYSESVPSKKINLLLEKDENNLKITFYFHGRFINYEESYINY